MGHWEAIWLWAVLYIRLREGHYLLSYPPPPPPHKGVSDGISMGTDGMSFSLQSRDIIADSIETVMSAQWYDANISLPGGWVGGWGYVTGAAAMTVMSAQWYDANISLPGGWVDGAD